MVFYNLWGRFVKAYLSSLDAMNGKHSFVWSLSLDSDWLFIESTSEQLSQTDTAWVYDLFYMILIGCLQNFQVNKRLM